MCGKKEFFKFFVLNSAACLLQKPGADRQGEDPLDGEEQNSGHSQLAQARLPLLFFHVQTQFFPVRLAYNKDAYIWLILLRLKLRIQLAARRTCF